ncbi:Membrane protein involved in aromatic hydrocarbon degradation [Candidatus Magnetomorum sp. HK-1]|nr:Membrane protein involved in aromatic hydrocarbon degradation [Candidatus Magnetomorum sp. HK-1]
MKKTIFLTFIFIILVFFSANASDYDFDMPSSFNPVGSGARAMGMGGAYMNTCSDGTAISWNPACLVRVKDYELALVQTINYRKEDNYFPKKPSISHTGRITQSDLNFAGVVIPFKKCQRQMAFSFSYQYLYDMSREWNFWDNRAVNKYIYHSDHWDFRQKGGLTAMSLAYGVQLNTQLTLGLSLNFWDNSLSENKWQQTYRNKGKVIHPGGVNIYEDRQTESYTFKGKNVNLGFMYRFNSRWYVGGVLKTPFRADIDYQQDGMYIDASGSTPKESIRKSYDLDMPLSYGLGMMIHPTDRFRLSFDAYCTQWDQFIQTDEFGIETFPITNKLMDTSDINATYQFRLGIEYLWSYKEYIIPLRSGIFYDPAPSHAKPDEFWGISLGTGLTKNHCYSFDIAYQYRYGNDVQTVDLGHLGFSQDVNEHSLYLSVILYWQTNYWNDEN